jgi:hypothetical protein
VDDAFSTRTTEQEWMKIHKNEKVMETNFILCNFTLKHQKIFNSTELSTFSLYVATVSATSSWGGWVKKVYFLNFFFVIKLN